MISALYFVHDRHVPLVHRDISPDNIMIKSIDLSNDNIHVVLSDFDVSRQVNQTELTAGVGKHRYLAPEVFAKIGHGLAKYGTKADVFSLGKVIIEMMSITCQSQIDGELNKGVNADIKPILQVNFILNITKY
jgi:serine/threonine protein kinase